MGTSVLRAPPDRIEREAVTVMERTTDDELDAIQAVWPPFEELVGLRGRRMFARIDERRGSYTVCTPVKAGDDPGRFGLAVGTLPGGRYLRGHLVGTPPEVYARIGAGMAELQAAMPADDERPLIEFYRRRDHIELWLPIRPG